MPSGPGFVRPGPPTIRGPGRWRSGRRTSSLRPVSPRTWRQQWRTAAGWWGPPGGHGSVRRRWIPKRSRPRLRAGPDAWRWCSATNGPASGERTLARCHALTRIPTDAGQPSLNVAQAVCVYAYALSRGSGRAERGTPRPGTDADLRRLEGVLDELLRRVCFVRPGRRGVGPLVASWRRSGLTRTEIRLWESAFRTLARSLHKPKDDGHLS